MTAAPVVAVVGATATGKTEVAEILADVLGGEVVCADSRQVFRALDVGTGKPTPEQRGTRAHHLFDALTLEQRPSAGWYMVAAGQACAAIRARGRTPILVGGSGLWLRAAQHGLSAEPPRDDAVRARLLAELGRVGPEALHARLARVDPVTAARLSPRDRQRITRALEVHEASGRPLAWWHERRGQPAVAGEWRVFELTATPRLLEERIARRTRWMFDSGLLEEVRAAIETGCEGPLRLLRAVGYDEALDLLAGRLDRARAEARTCLRTRQLAKRQRTWFRHQVEAARLEVDQRTVDDLVAAVRDGLSRVPGGG